MQILKAGTYSTKQIIEILYRDVLSAVQYIDAVITNYEHTPHDSEHFSDVLMVESFDNSAEPQGVLRKALWGRHGVYVFAVKDRVHLSYEQIREYSSMCTGAGFYDWHEKELIVGQHFYQGSSTNKSLYSRIKEHYETYTEISAMQLNNTHRIFMKDKLRLFLFPIKRELQDASFFIRMVEKELHTQFPAATGSSRT